MQARESFARQKINPACYDEMVLRSLKPLRAMKLLSANQIKALLQPSFATLWLQRIGVNVASEGKDDDGKATFTAFY